MSTELCIEPDVGPYEICFIFSVLIFLNSVFYDLSTFSHQKECLIIHYTTWERSYWLFSPQKIMQKPFSPQTKCCSITNRRPLICEGILVTLHCIRVKLLNILVSLLDSPCALFSQPAVHRDYCYLSSLEDGLFWWKLGCSSLSTSLRLERGVVCVFNNVSLIRAELLVQVLLVCGYISTLPNSQGEEDRSSVPVKKHL